MNLVSRRAFAETMKLLLANDLKFTVIGGAVIALATGADDMGEDVDLFAESPNVINEEDAYRSIADSNSWDYGQTWLGTPRITVIVGDEEVPVEFYDNLYDFYVPEDFISSARKVEVEGVRVKAIGVEQYLVLKARAGRKEDEEALKNIGESVKRGRLKVEASKVLQLASEFDEGQVIVRRLREYKII